MGMGQRGANRGPNALRHSPAEYVTWGEYSLPHMETMINPLKDIVAVDYGDAPNDPLSTERSMEPIREIIREAIEVENSRGEHVIPFVIGGDHSISYPSIAAAADVYGKGNIGVIHFDAHYDATQMLGHLASHGSQYQPPGARMHGGYRLAQERNYRSRLHEPSHCGRWQGMSTIKVTFNRRS